MDLMGGKIKKDTKLAREGRWIDLGVSRRVNMIKNAWHKILK